MSQNKNFENSGSLFINTDKKKLSKERDTSKWADMQGKINIYGIEFYISAWTKIVQKDGEMKGQKFQSLNLKPVDEDECSKLESLIKNMKSGNPSTTPSADVSDEFDDMDDDLPF